GLLRAPARALLRAGPAAARAGVLAPEPGLHVRKPRGARLPRALPLSRDERVGRREWLALDAHAGGAVLPRPAAGRPALRARTVAHGRGALHDRSGMALRGGAPAR